MVSCAVFVLVRRLNRTNTYYVAYVGRYQRLGFDRLHELALKKYLNEINEEMRDVRLELKTFDNDGDAKVSRKIYEEIFEDGRFVVAIDNTWGSELQPIASFIREKRIPVVAINADRQGTDFAHNAVFLGHDDDVPRIVTGFVNNVLKCSEIILINEENYALKEEYRKELEATPVKVTKLSVSSNTVDTNERDRLFQELAASFSDMGQRQITPTVVINTHAYWGVEIINYIDTQQKGVTILGGPYVVNWSNYNQFSRNDNGNSLIMLTTPSDALTNKVYLDIAEIRHADSEVSKIVNAQLFVKRCLDAVSIVRGALYDESALRFKPAVSRSDFTDFFQHRLKSSAYTGRYDLYEFDENLLLRNEKAFEKHFRGEVFSFPKQLNSHGGVIPNVYFGLEIINISNIDTANRSFHADFFYWVKFDKEYPDIEKYIHFRNEKNSSKSAPIFSDSLDGQTVYNLYKKSADFTMNVDFGRYPLDTQDLNIELELINPADSLRISFDYESFKHSKSNVSQFNLGEWYRKDLYVTVDNFIGKSPWGSSRDEDRGARRFKTLNVRMPISRRFASPFVTIILPLIMMGLTAIAVLTVKDNSFSNTGQICIGIFLSIVTYSIAFSQIAPRSSGLTIADILFYGTFVTIFLVVLKVILFNSSMVSDHVRDWVNERASKVGIVALICYGLMICLTVIIGLDLT